MLSNQEIRTSVDNMPLDARKSLLLILERSIADEQARLAQSSLKADLELVIERLASYDRDKSPSKTIRFSDMKQLAFGGET